MSKKNSQAVKTQKTIICPYCFQSIKVMDLNIYDVSNDLKPPQFFNINCVPLNSKMELAEHYVCPECKCEIPFDYAQYPALHISMVGIGGSGKTCFSVFMYQALRQWLNADYHFARADSWKTNDTFQRNCNKLTNDKAEFVEIEKTENSDVLVNNKHVPLIFRITKANSNKGIILNLYDYRGEDFTSTGEDAKPLDYFHSITQNPIKPYLFILYDPNQENLGDENITLPEYLTKLPNLRPEEDGSKYNVAVIVCKYDTWSGEFLKNAEISNRENLEPVAQNSDGRSVRQAGPDNLERITEVSGKLKNWRSKIKSELQNAVESLDSNAVYIPVSATGCSKTPDGKFVKKDIIPFWVEVPIWYVLSKELEGFVF